MRDAELLGLLRENPEKGLKALTKQYGGLVYAVVRRNLSEASNTDIEACAADVFAEFYLELDKYDPSKGSVKAWLCTMARHNALDAARKTKETLPLDEEVLSEESSVESEHENAELRRAVLSEVKNLPEPDREILLRKFYLGESSKEIAARLKMSVSNVDTRTSRAVEKLRKRLEEWR
ncbi:MAG: sigma-70 family RNA polymerase sigma factor [Oscillospiraceae bacterium]|nr:sigma-70 family RNA polymerase sigma factor [Oscillospiraceae bacterium]